MIRFVINGPEFCAYAVSPKEGQWPFLGATTLDSNLKLSECNYLFEKMASLGMGWP